MEEAGSSSPSSSSPSSAAASKQAFAMLQPFCSRLLELPLRRGQSDSEESLIVSLRQALRNCPLQGLRVCLEYVLLPLQLLLDASVACRSRRHAIEVKSSKPTSHSDSGLPQKLYISDKLSEGVLLCIEELLLQCPLTTTSQMGVLLRKLTAAAMLSPQEASEEFRHAAVKCLKMLFLRLKPCGRTCGCKLSALPDCISFKDGCLEADFFSALGFSSRHSSGRKYEADTEESSEECLIEFLQSETMSAAVGHLLSLFLQISENEASMGRVGSANLRIDAILTLRILLLKVGTANALAFFLPGVATRLVKSLQSSKQMNTGLSELSYPTGAAGSSGAAEQAVRAFSELLALVLADERNRDIFEASLQSAVVQANFTLKENDYDAEAALATLRKGSYASDKNNGKQTKHMDSHEIDGQSTAVQSNDSKILQNGTSANNKGLDSFRVDRNKAWLEYTTKQINSLLALCFPALCRHPSPSIRLASTESIVILMSTCRLTLEGFMPTLLESLLAMACDEWPHVASVANARLVSLMKEQHVSCGVSNDLESLLQQIIRRLIERLPKAMFSGDESVALFFCRQLLAAMFFAGPDGVSECIFQPSAATTQFVVVMVQCLSFNVALAGTSRQLSQTSGHSLGYIPGIVELTTDKVAQVEHDKSLSGDFTNIPSNLSSSRDGKLPSITHSGSSELQQLPRLPPWFRLSGGCKFYSELAGILRMVGLSSMFESRGARDIFGLIEELLAPLRSTFLYAQGEEHREQFFFGNGQWQRRAAASIAVLNEVFYGASGLWVHSSSLPFENSEGLSCWHPWEDLARGLSSEVLGDCVGDVLHEYSADAIWKIPIDATLGMFNTPLPADAHILKDNSFLQQVIIEGIGVLAQSVGKLFEEQGFLGSVLYLLLERLGCADYAASSTADLALHVVSSSCGYLSVRALIVASTDYIVDSLCRQLRHIDLFPNAPNMLVAVLRYTGAGQDLVPLLQEPMRSISLELQIPARREHPGNTLPMLRALCEIVKSAKGETMCMLEKTSLRKEAESEEPSDGSVVMNRWEKIASSLKESQRIRQSLQDIVILCLDSSSPLMASKDPHKCLLALEIAEVGVAALTYLDEVAKHEKEERAEARNLAGGGGDDIMDFNEEEPPKLLPTVNRVWPHLAACLKHTAPSVLVQTSKVIASVVACCGGDFFTRRFQKDVVPRFLTILCEGTRLQLKPESSKSSDRRLLLNFEGNSVNAFKEFAPASLLKVQEAMLACISEVATVKKSTAALLSSLEQLAAVVVGLACGFPLLQDKATQALLGLSNIDADLVWILVADLAYGDGLQLKEMNSPGPMFPKISQLLPPLLGSDQEALWKQLSGKEVTFNITSLRARTILTELESCRSSDLS